MQEQILGIDIGGTGIKGALVDITKGEMVTERLRAMTPQPATPEAVAKTFAQLVKQHSYEGPIGVGFPSVIRNGVAITASNIDKAWIGTNAEAILSDMTGQPVYVLNDADAAGIAEMSFGIGQRYKGLVVMITIGSGLGSALFMNGELIPNTEFGHFKMHGDIAEKYASNKTRKSLDLSWEDWGKRFNAYLQELYLYLSPNAFILSGGISKKFNKFEAFLDVPIPIEPASLLNNAGTVGAALYAEKRSRS
ncbi:MAG: ROK family protein [Saprospiraceae bacterium]|nr:ROK family protein [Saprospiraceae bacterium]